MPRVSELVAFCGSARFEIWCRPVPGCTDLEAVRCHFGLLDRHWWIVTSAEVCWDVTRNVIRLSSVYCVVSELVVLSGTPTRRRLLVASLYSVEESNLRAFDTYYSPNPHYSSYSISSDCHRFTPLFGARLVALSSSLQDLEFGTILEPWFRLSWKCEVVVVFVYFCDFRPVVSSVILNAEGLQLMAEDNQAQRSSLDQKCSTQISSRSEISSEHSAQLRSSEQILIGYSIHRRVLSSSTSSVLNKGRIWLKFPRLRHMKLIMHHQQLSRHLEFARPRSNRFENSQTD
ncbi:hypothetical protein F511_32872 [Dorcoceras hygrometricum]|uniref:Uncharacterized protein n=1 Tax=Dorcoceras hygrometricum TaxID=472368 RepID=A0A2Z7DAL9_9LAMI|nr:hypothetical protein F511_32872 [Dorcoceras hygrometricum]